MIYKSYMGKMDIDEDEGMIYGHVIGLNKDGITFSGKTVEEAKQDFQDAVDSYLSWAREEGFEPEKSYQGKLLVRVTPEMHKKLVFASAKVGASVNTFIITAIQEKIDQVDFVAIET